MVDDWRWGAGLVVVDDILISIWELIFCMRDVLLLAGFLWLVVRYCGIVWFIVYDLCEV